MADISYLLLVVVVLIILEILLGLLVKWLRRDFQWLITDTDELPSLDKVALQKFLNNSFDPELGWVRQPNTSGREKSRNRESTYKIDSNGARALPGIKNRAAAFSCYGDSFTFCRQVNDDETWPYYLATHTDTTVLNFGVGNYGLDQAFLRLKREFPKSPTPVVVMAVVPETISRILSAWKHYSEYGNTFAFKPRFRLEEHGLELVPNLADTPDKFFDLESLLPMAQQEDHFYSSKFRRDILKFPYSGSLLRTARRNIPLVFSLCLSRLFGTLRIQPNYSAALFKRFVLDRNIAICANLYREPRHEDLLIGILQKFTDFCRDNNAQPVFMMLPQLTDIEYVIRTGDLYYERFMVRAQSILPCLDLSQQLLAHHKPSRLYSDDQYGGHFNPTGNKLVGSALFEFLRHLGLTHSLTQQIRGQST